MIDLHPTPRYNPRPSRGSSQTKQEPISVVISASAGTVKPSAGSNHLSQRNRSKSTSKAPKPSSKKSSKSKPGRKPGRGSSNNNNNNGGGKKSSSSSSNSSLAAAGGAGESEEDEEEPDEDGEEDGGGSSSTRGASKDRDREEDADEDEEEMDYEEDEEEEDDNLFRVNDRMGSAEREFLQRLQEFLDPRALQYADSQAATLKNGKEKRNPFLFWH